MKDLHQLGVVESAAAIRSGEITAEDLATALLRRAKALNALNAFVNLDEAVVLDAARAADLHRASGKAMGPLHGVPIALKDNINTAAFPTTAGTPGLRRHRPKANAPAAQALIDAGAIVFGKVGLHELAFGVTSNNAGFGAIHNPFDPAHVPGGSSGGSGAAVGARIVPASIGTDTGGSVRVPASFCGVLGFRPTVRRWPQAGIVPISATRDTAGPLARQAADLAVIDAVVTGADGALAATPLRGMRIGVPRSYFWEDLEPETARICEAALDTLKHAGAVLIEADLPGIGAINEAVSFIVALYEAKGGLDRYLEGEGLSQRFADLVAEAASPDVKGTLASLLDSATAIPEQAYRDAMSVHRPKLIELYRGYFAAQNVTSVIFPTTPLPAPLIGADETLTLNGRELPTFLTIIRNTDPGSNAGIPGISMPVGLTSGGLPVGLAFDAPAGGDRDLLGLAVAVEAVFPAPRAP
jgi:Asp-tRNA(Asn)/Glu-tRNA(Gln) amidotransferase A subunit family amidase